MSWQSVNIVRERIAAGDNSPRTKAIYEGILEVLEPACWHRPSDEERSAQPLM